MRYLKCMFKVLKIFLNQISLFINTKVNKDLFVLFKKNSYCKHLTV